MNPDELVDEFDIDEVYDTMPDHTFGVANYNVAPTDPVPAVFERTDKVSLKVTRRLSPLNWGLVPSWAKERKIGASMINARFETIDTKPAFRKAFASRRCLLPADGYYEWYVLDQPPGTPKSKIKKQPFFIHRADGGPLVMAGIYEIWRDPAKERDDDSAWLRTCSVITTTATDALGHIHDRMPMVIMKEAYDAWLDPKLTNTDIARDLLAVTDADALEAYAVSTEVNSVKNNGPQLVAPLTETPESDGLF